MVDTTQTVNWKQKREREKKKKNKAHKAFYIVLFNEEPMRMAISSSMIVIEFTQSSSLLDPV